MAIAAGKDSALWLTHISIDSLNGSLACPSRAATKRSLAMRTNMINPIASDVGAARGPEDLAAGRRRSANYVRNAGPDATGIACVQ